MRTQEKADLVKDAFPSVRIVLGNLDDAELLKEEAAKADIVLRTTEENSRQFRPSFSVNERL